MTLRNKMAGFALAGLFVMTSVGTAAAQDPESGETGTWQQPQPTGAQPQPGGWQQQQNPPPQGGWQQQPPQGGGQQPGWNAQPPAGGGENEAPPSAATAPEARTGDSDHTSAVGHIGIGWFGIGAVTLGIGDGMGGGRTIDVATPAIGVRYWLSDMIGLDVALGFGFASLGGTIDTPAVVTDINGGSGFALTVHGGLPISVYHGEHYSFQLVPEIDLGFGSGTIEGVTPDDDTNVGAFSFQIGARAGAEIHFGFIGIPQLALQATVGLALRYESNTVNNDFGNTAGSTITTVNRLSVSTTVQDEPWDIFSGSIRAIYYWF